MSVQLALIPVEFTGAISWHSTATDVELSVVHVPFSVVIRFLEKDKQDTFYVFAKDCKLHEAFIQHPLWYHMRCVFKHWLFGGFQDSVKYIIVSSHSHN